MTQDLDFNELIEHCKKRIVYLLKGSIDKSGWKWEEFGAYVADLSKFFTSRDEPSKRQEILDNVLGLDPFMYTDLIPDINIMVREDDGRLNVEYPDGEVIHVILNLKI